MIIDVPIEESKDIVDIIMEKYQQITKTNKIWCSTDNMLGLISPNGRFEFCNMGTKLLAFDGLFDVYKISEITIQSISGNIYRISQGNEGSYDKNHIEDFKSIMLFTLNNMDSIPNSSIRIEYYTYDWEHMNELYKEINDDMIFNWKGTLYDIIAIINKNGLEFGLEYYSDI